MSSSASASANARVNPVYKAMNRPLTVLGAERRLFFVALISGGAIFSLLHSLFGGIGLFVVGVVVARIATKHDVENRAINQSIYFQQNFPAAMQNVTSGVSDSIRSISLSTAGR